MQEQQVSLSTSDYDRITNIQRHAWGTGDIHICTLGVTPAATMLVDAVDPHAGQRVLDIACSTGSVALIAARRNCEVTGIDYVPTLIERAQARAKADDVKIDFLVGDARKLPFEDGHFDFVLSNFGIAFAADQEAAAKEAVRVCRNGGKIAMANWMPEGAGGEIHELVESYVTHLPGLKPPTRWGTEKGVRELFENRVSSLAFARRRFYLYFRTVEDLVDLYRMKFGPTVRAFKSLQAPKREKLTDELRALIQSYNRATDGTLKLECDYLEAIMVR